MDIAKFVSELFEINCLSEKKDTQLSSKTHHKLFITLLCNNGFSELNFDKKK